MFYERGLVCETIQANEDGELLLQLHASDDCSLGAHAFRVRSDAGYSELRTIAVAPFPIVRDVPSNASLTLGHSVVGKLEDGQPNRYYVSLSAGQRLSLDVEAIRLGIDMIDTGISVLDPDGQVIAQADDSHLYRQDPILSVVARVAGKYTIEISDAGRNAGEFACYLLHISDGPRPTGVFPLGGRPGTDVQLSFTGDARGTWSTTHRLPGLDNAKAAAYQLFAVQDGQPSATPLPFRLSELPSIQEEGSNDSFVNDSIKNPVEVPLAINGRIEQPLDRDCFWMRGVPGQRLDAQIFAQRLGSAADTLLTVVDAAENPLANSDDIDSLDSRVEFTVPADGRFGISVDEKRGKGGEGFAYRIEVVPVRPTAEVFLPRRDRLSQELQTISVPVGNRVLALMAVRKDQATGATHLRFPQLPKGVTAHWTEPRDDQSIIPVVFEAAKDAGLSGQQIPVEVTVHSSDHTAVGEFRQVTDLVRGPADAIYWEHSTNRLALCTREEVPIRLQFIQPAAPLMQDGTLDLRVAVERQPGFDGDIHLIVPWLPPWIDAEPNLTIPAEATEATLRLRAWQQAEKATWPVVVEGAADTASRRRRARSSSGSSTIPSGDAPPPVALYPRAVSSLPVELKISAAPAVGHFEEAAAEQGQVITVNCKLTATDQLRDVSDLVATLEGLPNRVQCEPVRIEAQPQIIQFQVRVDASAPVGQFVGLACRLSGKMAGEAVSCVVSRDGSLAIASPGQIARDEQGRPLNRIDALRQKNRTAKN